ncbi:glycoside hydrolase family 16 protein [Polyporus arcularius HHB13444]|uniref:Glycoside hydrolase family 16 protein n=1 Tax=Polyporus arcularius HHB13444 TaxID=1314778 RepID=A0A5C3PSM5_9APHY|nr:glycoside hydrolase family 16 protein [Polyporus arcularius HHB13444]
MHTATLSGVVYTLLVALTPAFGQYNLVKNYAGQSFFTGWDYADGFDNTTNGAVNWLNQSAATAANLTSINSAGRAVIKVDDFTNLPNVTVVTDQLKRNSVTLSTHDFFPVGSVFIFDAVHIPFGCSVWPAFWTRGPNWPNGGEIDILEEVNLVTNNQMVLHTTPGCTQAPGVQQLGTTKGTDCSAGVNSRVGCAVTDTRDNSFGAGFNNAGGGVWATQFDASGIFIWFWTRASVPSDVSISATSADPAKWGTPTAAWPASSCNITNFFQPQQIVLDITLCGDFAGQPNIYQATCGKPGETVGPNTCYADNVNGTGANYADAFFEVNYVKVFSLNSTVLSPSSSGGSTVLETATTTASVGGSSATEKSGGTSGDNTAGGNGAATGPAVAGLTVLGATVVAAFAWAFM